MDHSCGQPNGARAPSPVNGPLLGPLPKAGGFPPLGTHGASHPTIFVLALDLLLTSISRPYYGAPLNMCAAFSTCSCHSSNSSCWLDVQSAFRCDTSSCAWRRSDWSWRSINPRSDNALDSHCVFSPLVRIVLRRQTSAIIYFNNGSLLLPCIATLKHPRTPPTNPSVDYPSGDASDPVSKRTRPLGIVDEVCFRFSLVFHLILNEAFLLGMTIWKFICSSGVIKCF